MSSKRSSSFGWSLSLKLTLWYTVFFVITTFGLFFFAYYIINSSIEQKEREHIFSQTQEYHTWYNEGGLPALQFSFIEKHNFGEIFFLRVLGERNEVLFYSATEGNVKLDLPQFDKIGSLEYNKWISIKAPNQRGSWLITATLLYDGLTLQVGKYSTQREDLLSHFRSLFYRIAVPILLFGIIGGGVLTFNALQPLRNLIHTVRNILSTGKIDVRVPARSKGSEMDQLVSLFNEMLDKNEKLINSMNHSLDNVAHDLRTPLTRLRVSAELALQEGGDIEAYRNSLADCLEESDNVLTILRTLMDVAEAETGTLKLDISKTSVSEIIKDVVELYQLFADEKGIVLSTKLSDGIFVNVDNTRIRQAIANILDNALKYSDSGSKVSISTNKEDGNVLISVADEGIGIPSKDMSRIWERLYRGDMSRSQRGLGLGLNLVQAIIKAHGGKITVESEVHKGSTFIISIPIKKNCSL